MQTEVKERKIQWGTFISGLVFLAIAALGIAVSAGIELDLRLAIGIAIGAIGGLLIVTSIFKKEKQE